MPALPTSTSQAAPQAAPVSFHAGTWHYSQPIFTDSATLGTTSQEFIHQIEPGGFLRGVSLFVTSTGGSLGTGGATAAADNPWNVIQSISLESVDGTPIIYPIDGYSWYLVNRYTQPWEGDPATDPTYSQSANPAFRMRLFVESRWTMGVLPNTDARAQYRLRYTLAPAASIFNGTGYTAPTVTVQGNLETYAQPPSENYAGQPIQLVPNGITVQRFISQQTVTTNSGAYTIQSNRVGNMIRSLILVFRSNGARTDLTGDPIRFRVDNTQLLSENRTRRDFDMDMFFKQGGLDTSPRPTGVYVYPRWHNPGDLTGQFWLPTTEATYLAWEVNGAPAGGTCEIITEDLAAAGPVPASLMGL